MSDGKTVMVEVDNFFDEGADKEKVLKTICDIFNIEASKFGNYMPVPLYPDNKFEGQPKSYILVVDSKTAEDMKDQKPDKIKFWADPPMEPFAP